MLFPLILLAFALFSTPAHAQFASANSAGTAGAACSGSNYAWPDASGQILHCVSSIWQVVGQPTSAAGSSGYVQFNSGGALGGNSALYWDNTNNRLGIGTTSPAGLLSLSGSGQTTSGYDTTSLGNALVLGDTGAASGNGGVLVFAAGAQAWRFAAIKGLVTSGSNNTQGDIAFSTRQSSTDTTLTEAMRIKSNGYVGIGTAPAYLFHTYDNSAAASSSYYHAVNRLDTAPTANTSASFFSLTPILYTSTAFNYTGSLRALYPQATHNGTGTVSTMYGINAYIGNAASGTITNAYGSFSDVQNANAAGIISNAFGAYNRVYTTSTTTSNIGTAIAAYNIVNVAGTGTIPRAYGSYNYVLNAATGTITSAYAAYSYLNNNTTGAITTGYSLFVDTNNGGTLTNWYGIYVDAVSGTAPVTSRYPIFVADTGTSYMAGGLRFAASNYINFGSTAGTGGYGMRDNAGSIEFKNSGGAWTSINQSSLIAASTTAAAPALAVSGDSDTGIFQVSGGANTLSFATGGTEAMRLTSDNRLAIGTTSAASQLTVYGNMSNASWTTTGLNFSIAAATLTDTSSAAAATVATRAAESFAIPTFASTNAITVTNAANVYIAGAPAAGTNTTITNAYAFYVGSGKSLLNGRTYIAGGTDLAAAGDTGFLVVGSVGGTNIGLDDNEIMARNNGATSPLYIQNEGGNTIFSAAGLGNVGIGTATPAFDLQLDGTSAPDLLIRSTATNKTSLHLRTDGSNSYINNMDGFVSNGASGNGILVVTGQTGIAFKYGNSGSAGADAMRIDSSGNVGIGTTSPAVTLDVFGKGRFDTNVVIQAASGTEGGQLILGYPGVSTVGETASTWNIDVYSNNALRFFRRDALNATLTAMYIDEAGNVGFGTVSPAAKVDIVGGLRVASASTITGTLTANSFIPTSATMPANGMYLPAANTVAFATSSTEAMRLTSDNRLAIGTTSAASQLVVAGDLSNAAWTLTGLNFSVAAATLTDTSSAAAATVVTRAAESFAIPTFASTNAITVTNAANVYIAGAPAAGTNTTITNPLALFVGAGKSYFGGNIGIGTAAPAALIELYNSVNGASYGQISTPGTQSGQFAALNFATKADGSTVGTATNLGWQIYARGNAYTTASQQNDLGVSYWNGTSWISNFTIDSATGNVGIGTQTPAATLDVNGYIKLKKNSSAPVACSATYDGSLALTSQYTLCYCKGSMATWYLLDNVGNTACTW